MTQQQTESIEATTPQKGALYSVDDGEGFFRVAKVLAVDPGGVHVRLYKNRFTVRPATTDPSKLDLGTIHDPDGFGMGHLPLTHRAFAAWLPVCLSVGSVTEEELDGYWEWQSAQGGYFGPSPH